MTTIPNVKNHRAQETCPISFYFIFFIFLFCFLFISLLIIICAVSMHHHYASPLHIATMHHHYILPLRIATTHFRYNCNISHIGKKRPKTRNMTTLKSLVRFLFFILLLILRCSPHLKRLFLNLFYAHQCAWSQIPHSLSSTPSMETMTNAKPCTMYVSSSL